MRKGAKVRVDEAKVALRTRTTDAVWARQLIGLAQDTKSRYMAEVASAATSFANKFEALIIDLPESDTDWATMPMNYVLWLYALGCRPEEHRKLYTGLGHACELAGKAKSTGMAVAKTHMPLSPIGRGLLAKPEKSFRLAKDRTFARLNMAMTGLCFTVFGKTGKSENQRVSEALAYAAPVVGTALPDVSSSVENSGTPHTASVSELNPLTSTMLFTTVPVKTCKLLLMLLLRRAWPLYRIETREVTREDFATNLLTYINVSIISDFELSRRTSLTFSNTYLW